MVLTSFNFSNILGSVYTKGNLVFTKDGNSIVSPVGNRVAVYDLVNNKSKTLTIQHRKDVVRIDLSPDGKVLISVDEDGRALFTNFKRSIVLHHFNFKEPVRDVKFSPNGKYILATHGSHAQIWFTPSYLLREFAPFVKLREYTGHFDDTVSVSWSESSKYFLTTSKDLSAKLYTVEPTELQKGEKFRPLTFSGHKDLVLAAYFSRDEKSIYTLSRDGALFVWKSKGDNNDLPLDTESETAIQSKPQIGDAVVNTRWGIAQRHYFNQASKVTSSIFHSPSNLLIVGFQNGVFGLWDLSSTSNTQTTEESSLILLHTLSISQERITSITINPSGEWLAFGCAKLGQLLVWEWQSESYILKQQSHQFDVNTLAFSPDAKYIVTGGEDGKVKVWNTTSGFCFITFSEHTSAISTVEFSKAGQVIFSASLDGTIRAYDLSRYRNFRTFTTAQAVQFHSLAVDLSGEVVCGAGTGGETWEIYVWSVQTGKLVQVLTGHDGPISALTFSPQGDRLISTSWDGTARVWELFGRTHSIEPLVLGSDGLCLAYKPNGLEFAVATLNGQILVFEVEQGKQIQTIEGRKDIAGGRMTNDRRTAQNNTNDKFFTSLNYTADGSCILAGGNSKFVCLYDVKEGVLLKRWEITQNFNLEGVAEFLDSRKLDENAGPLDSLDQMGDLSDLEERLQSKALPGVIGRGDMSQRKHQRPLARTKCVRLAPTGQYWAAATSEGLLLYSLDSDFNNTTFFDPVELDLDITPENILFTVDKREFLKALIMAFRISERNIIRKVYESTPLGDIKLVVKNLPDHYIDQLINFIANELERSSPHFELNLLWIEAALASHGKYLQQHSTISSANLRALYKGLEDAQSNVTKLLDSNTFTMQYLLDQSKRNKAQANTMQVEQLQESR